MTVSPFSTVASAVTAPSARLLQVGGGGGTESGSGGVELIPARISLGGSPVTCVANSFSPYDNEEKKEWFIVVCQEAGIDPAARTLFDYLEADDKLIGKA